LRSRSRAGACHRARRRGSFVFWPTGRGRHHHRDQRSGKSFICDWKGKSWTYGTTDKTAFWVGKTKGSWADLKMGSVVQVKYHRGHGQRVADTVRVQASK
jgi:hypothetical protein